jgi:hypothetical protein
MQPYLERTVMSVFTERGDPYYVYLGTKKNGGAWCFP